MSDLENKKPQPYQDQSQPEVTLPENPSDDTEVLVTAEVTEQLGTELSPEVPNLDVPNLDIEWNSSTAGLDFIEEKPMAADEPSAHLEPFAELARRVAETTARNSDVENAEIHQMEQMNLGALETELTEAENDADPDPVEFIEHDQLLSIIESLLFSTDKPVSTATIKQIFKGSNVRTKDITRAMDLLAREYASSQRGVTLEDINGGYQLRTKVDNVEYLRRLAKARPFRLSGPALEVMAIVAYKQPVTKHEVDEIRGVESGHLLRALMERSMISFGDKSELPGKPMTYQSTRKFLETFGLRNIRELPSLSEIDELLPDGIGEVEEDEKETLSDLTDQMSQVVGSTYSEGEDELTKINEQLKAVDTTSEFFEQEKIRERERRDRDRAQDIREKLVLEGAVEDKDRRWLERYEAKLLQPQPGVSLTTEAQTAEPNLDGELAALTADALDAANNKEIDAELAEDLSADARDADADSETDHDSDVDDEQEAESNVHGLDWDDGNED